MNIEWLNGFALISERRRIRLPAGESVVRFEGVAGGIVPQSAIVTGFPDGIVERNRDAYLLSPATLIDRSLGRRVHLRRTSSTGEVREQEAVVRSSAAGGVVLETPDGIEALRCTGVPETIVYDGVPDGLSPMPTRRRSPAGSTTPAPKSPRPKAAHWSCAAGRVPPPVTSRWKSCRSSTCRMAKPSSSPARASSGGS
jgi:hypothetical protein